MAKKENVRFLTYSASEWTENTNGLIKCDKCGIDTGISYNIIIGANFLNTKRYCNMCTPEVIASGSNLDEVDDDFESDDQYEGLDGESMAYDIDPDEYYAEESKYDSYEGEPETFESEYGSDEPEYYGVPEDYDDGDYEAQLEQEFENGLAEREEAYYGRDEW